MAVANRVSNVEPNNLDWLEIEDEEGVKFRYFKGSGSRLSQCGTSAGSVGVATKRCGHRFSKRTLEPGKWFYARKHPACRRRSCLISPYHRSSRRALPSALSRPGLALQRLTNMRCRAPDPARAILKTAPREPRRRSLTWQA
jgi:hypothetical protein